MSEKRKEIHEQQKIKNESSSSDEQDDDDFDEEGNVGESDDGWSNSSESEIINSKLQKSGNNKKKLNSTNNYETSESSSSSEDSESDDSDSTSNTDNNNNEKKIEEVPDKTRETRSNSDDYRQTDLYKQLEAFKSPDRLVKKDSVSNLVRKSGSLIEHTKTEENDKKSEQSMESLFSKLEQNNEKIESNEKIENDLEQIVVKNTSSEDPLSEVLTRPRSSKISGSEIKSRSETGGLTEKAADDLQMVRARVTKQKTQSLEIPMKQVENILATGGREEKVPEKSNLTSSYERRNSKDSIDSTTTTAAKKSKHRRIKSINSVKTKLILKGKFDEISILPHSKSTNVHSETGAFSPPNRRKSGKGSGIQSFSTDTEKPGKVTQAELNLLKEVEEFEMLKDKLLHSDDKKLKKKMKLEEKEKENQLEEQRKLQQVNHLLAQRNKNKTENLLPENDPDPAIRMRNLTVNEIVSSERDYVLDLELLIELFSDPLSQKNIISEQIHSTIFSTISNILNLNKNLLVKLEKLINSQEGPKISPFFTELKFYHKMYSDYCNNHSNSTVTVASLMKKQGTFKQFIEETQMDPRCNGLFFESFLIKPVQRICKYPLLLRELIKHQPDEVERKQLENVLEDISTVVGSINETKRAAENINKILSIQKYVEMKNNELLQPGRTFVKEGTFSELCKNGENQAIYLCLFNDMLLHGIKKKNKFGSMRRADKFQQYENLPLYSVLVNGRCVTPNALEIQCNTKKFTIVFATPSEKRDWYKILKEYIANAHTETTPDTKSGSGIKRAQQTTLAATSDTSQYKKEKVKCFLNKGTPQQRIRKVSLLNVDTLDSLYKVIKNEFEWEDSVHLQISYTDLENDLIEVSTTTSIWEIHAEVKAFILTKTDG